MGFCVRHGPGKVAEFVHCFPKRTGRGIVTHRLVCKRPFSWWLDSELAVDEGPFLEAFSYTLARSGRQQLDGRIAFAPVAEGAEEKSAISASGPQPMCMVASGQGIPQHARIAIPDCSMWPQSITGKLHPFHLSMPWPEFLCSTSQPIPCSFGSQCLTTRCLESHHAHSLLSTLITPLRRSA